MKRVFDICKDFDQDFRPPFEKCKDLGKIRKFIKSIDDKDIKNTEIQAFEDMKLRIALDYSYLGWQKAFKQGFMYKRPFIVNGYEVDDFFKQD